MSDAFVSELISSITEGGLFTEDEARRLLRCVTAETQEALSDNLEAIVMWARETRHRMATLDAILELAAADAVEVQPADGGDVALRIRPGTEIEMMPNGRAPAADNHGG